MIKVLFISVHPAPYRDSYLSLINKDPDIDLTVLHLFSNDVGHPYFKKTRNEFKSLRAGFFFFKKRYFHPKVPLIVYIVKHQVIVIPGISTPTTLLVFLISLLRKKKIIITCDSNYYHYNKPPYSGIIKWFYRKLYSKVSAVFVPGFASECYFHQEWGINRKKIFQGSYSLPTSLCETKSKPSLTYPLSLNSESIVFLMVGNFVHKRNHIALTRAFNRVSKMHDNLQLILIGSKSDSSTVVQYCKINNIQNVIFLYDVPFEILSEYVFKSSVYIHSGCEYYSTATQFAAICAKPLLISDRVGAWHDYVKINRNGFVYACYNEDDLISKITLMTKQKDRYIEMGELSRAIAEKRSEHWAADSLTKAILWSMNKEAEK